jgi:CO/xanthine dehydrogenase FAD-binding subunit
VVNAATAADSIPPLLSVDALALIASSSGHRTMSVNELIAGVSKSSLQNDELIEEFLLPIRPLHAMIFEKIGRRKALAISRINLAVNIKLHNGQVDNAAVVVGAVGKTAYRVIEVEKFLQGKTLDDGLIEQAAILMEETVARNLAGRPTTPYKKKIAHAVLKRALRRIAGGEGRCNLE